MIARGLDDLFHPFIAADVAGIDAQAGRPAGSRFQRAPVMEMDVGDDRHIDLPDDVLQRQRAFLVRARDPDDIDPRGFRPFDLRDRAGHIGGQGIRHGLHRDRRAVAYRDFTDIDPAGLAPDDLLVGAITHAGLLHRGHVIPRTQTVAGGLEPVARRYYGVSGNDPLLPSACRRHLWHAGTTEPAIPDLLGIKRKVPPDRTASAQS